MTGDQRTSLIDRSYASNAELGGKQSCGGKMLRAPLLTLVGASLLALAVTHVVASCGL